MLISKVLKTGLLGFDLSVTGLFAPMQAQTSEPMQTFFEWIYKPGEVGPSSIEAMADCHIQWKRWVPLSVKAASYGLDDAYAGETASVLQQVHWFQKVADDLMATNRSGELPSVISAATARVEERIEAQRELFGFDQVQALALCYAVDPGLAPPGWDQTISASGDALLIDLTAETANTVLDQATGPLILAVSAQWYTQKNALKQQLRTLARANPDVPVYYVNDDKLGMRAISYRIMAYPTVLLLDGQALKARITGRKTDADYAAWLEANG
ncbi:MAG: thioredoxin family protein [Pseudomonadota bacterium]